MGAGVSVKRYIRELDTHAPSQQYTLDEVQKAGRILGLTLVEARRVGERSGSPVWEYEFEDRGDNLMELP